jgi:hypothetical protein
MSRLDDIKNCHVCGSRQLTPRLRVPISDILTGEETIREVIQCEECDTLHYINDGVIEYEFSCSTNKLIKTKDWRVKLDLKRVDG